MVMERFVVGGEKGVQKDPVVGARTRRRQEGENSHGEKINGDPID